MVVVPLEEAQRIQVGAVACPVGILACQVVGASLEVHGILAYQEAAAVQSPEEVVLRSLEVEQQGAHRQSQEGLRVGASPTQGPQACLACRGAVGACWEVDHASQACRLGVHLGDQEVAVGDPAVVLGEPVQALAPSRRQWAEPAVAGEVGHRIDHAGMKAVGQRLV